ncbi:MAG: metal-dependent transcriptional regulator [Acidobacteria bacterium]|nr:metal-dependent transcriptional regulator [Acidobacteriota bacterium]
MRITISKENYLKAIAEAEAEGEAVIAATLKRWLRVSAPAVTMATRRLVRDGLIRVAPNGHITLTTAGADIANRLLYRHHLIERMLAEVFGMEWYKIHDEAEQMEHAISADFERLLDEKLGGAGPCPHGSPLQLETAAQRRARGLRPLAELEGRGVVEYVFERDRPLLEYLDGLGIRPHALLEAVHAAPTGSGATGIASAAVEVSVEGKRRSVEPAAANRVWVRPV